MPIPAALRDHLLEHRVRQRGDTGRVFGTPARIRTTINRAERRWADCALEAISLHECRHTYASLLMAAGYTIKELMEFMGHADLQMVNRYVKLLPQPGEDDAADRLNAYLARASAAKGVGA